MYYRQKLQQKYTVDLVYFIHTSGTGRLLHKPFKKLEFHA